MPNVYEQARRLHIQSDSNPLDIQESDVALASLNLTHVGSVHPCQVGQGFLRHPKLLPPSSYGLTQSDQNLLLGRGTRYACNHSGSTPYRRRTGHGIYDPL
jgi:hypothetical protein